MDLELKTQVVSAEVYTDRARVTRAGEADMAAGRYAVRVSGLPMSVQTDTLRAAGSGAAVARLLGVRAEIEEYAETPSERVAALTLDLEAAKDAVGLCAARLAVFERDVQHLDALAAQAETFARGLALRERSVEQQAAIYDFSQTRRLDLSARIGEARREQREAERRVDHAQRLLSQASTGGRRQRRVAVIELEVAEPGRLGLAVSYVIGDIGWEPRYDLRILGAALELRYLASVHQATGEDWKDVALTLSTAQPALSLRVPELDPWPIQPLQPPVVYQAAKGAPARARVADVEMVAQALPAPAPMAAEAAVVEDAGVAVNFKLPSRADVPGGGTPRIVTIAELPLEPRWDYATAPRRTPAAFRRARVVNATPYTWLAGPVSLFEGDTYLGPTSFDLVARGQEAELYLGVDDRIRVEAEPTQRDVEKTLLGDKRRLKFGMRYTIENLRDIPVAIQVRDHIPHPAHELISVKIDSADPRPAKQDELGLLTWDLELPAGAKRVVQLVFTVEHPRGMSITGLPA